VSPNQEAAAKFGLATNPALPIVDRLALALEALAFYEAHAWPVIEAAQEWAGVTRLVAELSPPLSKPSRGLLAAVNAYETGASSTPTGGDDVR
jgi:hypothetical protein